MRKFVLSFVVCVGALTTPAAAEECSPDRTLAALLAQPDNVAIAFEHAQCAIKLGDNEAAVATLEGLLLLTPDNAELEVEIATLYKRMNANTLAQAHFQNVLESDDASDEVKQRARSGLATLGSNNDEGISFTHYSALRTQNNANLGLLSPAISVAGAAVIVPNNQLRKGDISFWNEGNFQARFGGSDLVDIWELNLDWAANGQREAKSLNALQGSFDFGPEISLASSRVLLRPYVSASISTLQEELFNQVFGGGITASGEIGSDWLWSANIAANIYRYDNNELRTTASIYDGTEVRAEVEFTYLYSESFAPRIGANVVSVDLEDDEYSFSGFGASIGATWISGFDPFGAGAVSADGSAEYSLRDYKGPWTSIALSEQVDHQLDFTLEIDVPITDHLSIVPRLEYTKLESDQPFSNYDALSTYIGARVTF